MNRDKLKSEYQGLTGNVITVWRITGWLHYPLLKRVTEVIKTFIHQFWVEFLDGYGDTNDNKNN